MIWGGWMAVWGDWMAVWGGFVEVWGVSLDRPKCACALCEIQHPLISDTTA